MNWVEFKYWRISRPAEKLKLKVVWKLPDWVVYWCVIRAAVKVEPNSNPSGVTAEQMLKEWESHG